jgi:hypothetical protein
VKVVCFGWIEACWFLNGGGGQRERDDGWEGELVIYSLITPFYLHMGSFPFAPPLAALTDVREPSSSGVEGWESRSSSHVSRAQSRGNKMRCTCDWPHGQYP